jgi:uncharacterized membrane protein
VTAGPLLRHRVTARTQLLVTAPVGLVVGIPVTIVLGPVFGLLAGWEAASAFFMIWVWLTIWPMDSRHTAHRAELQDPTRAATDVILLTAATASLVAVGFARGGASHTSGTAEILRVILGLASVVLSWGVVHTIFTLRYARIYYTGEDGGVDFNQREPPDYRDFAYLAFTIGMTFQVSDTNIEAGEIRRAALQHSLLSYLFGTGILATTVNLVATLSSQH